MDRRGEFFSCTRVQTWVIWRLQIYYLRLIHSLFECSSSPPLTSYLTALLRAALRPHFIHFAHLSGKTCQIHECVFLLFLWKLCIPSANLRARGWNWHSRCWKLKVDTYLLPVLLQRRHGREVAGVVHELKFLKDTVVRQDIHALRSGDGKTRMIHREGGGKQKKKEKKRKNLYMCVCASSLGSVRPLNPLLSY